MKKYKVVIIGSGIAGMSSAIYLKRGGIEPVIIEESAPGGQLNNIPNVENYPGHISISGPDLAMNIYSQVNNLKIPYLFREIKKIDLNKKIIDDEIEFDYLIIATGRRHRELNLEHEEELIGRGISYCAICDGAFFKNKSVVVVGGSSSALTEGLYLSSICAKVTIIHRRDRLSGENYLIDKINNTNNIDIIYDANLSKYNIDKGKLVGVTLDNGKVVDASGVFISIGQIPNSELFDVEKDNGYILVNDKYETSTRDVYAIGDVIKKDFYQLTTASGDATIAASSIIRKENIGR